MPFMIDLFSGLGGASAAMRDRGWDVITVDSEDKFKPDVVGDIAEMQLEPTTQVDLVWASPPCTEFARTSMPWTRKRMTGPPSLALVEAALRIVDEIKPTWWILENVRGAVPYLRDLSLLGHAGPVYMWGEMPRGFIAALKQLRIAPYKERLSGLRPDLRSKTPREISELVALSVENALEVAT